MTGREFLDKVQDYKKMVVDVVCDGVRYSIENYESVINAELLDLELVNTKIDVFEYDNYWRMWLTLYVKGEESK